MLSSALVDGKQWKLKKADILESPQERGPSDHVPLSVELELNAGNSEAKKTSKYLAFAHP